MKKDKKLNLKKSIISNLLISKIVGGTSLRTPALTDLCTDTVPDL